MGRETHHRLTTRMTPRTTLALRAWRQLDAARSRPPAMSPRVVIVAIVASVVVWALLGVAWWLT